VDFLSSSLYNQSIVSDNIFYRFDHFYLVAIRYVERDMLEQLRVYEIQITENGE
jgi:hypothetical protein